MVRMDWSGEAQGDGSWQKSLVEVAEVEFMFLQVGQQDSQRC